MVETHIKKGFMRFARAALPAAGVLALSISSAGSATTTQNMTVQMTISTNCAINSAPTLNFGNVPALTANTDATSTIQVTCSNSTPYNIGLSAGGGSGATFASRKMTNGSNTINYTLYRDSARTNVWGETIGTDTLSATGTGSAQNHVVYGRVPTQTTPTPASYSDTILITVTY